jgi:hypothetical protein
VLTSSILCPLLPFSTHTYASCSPRLSLPIFSTIFWVTHSVHLAMAHIFSCFLYLIFPPALLVCTTYFTYRHLLSISSRTHRTIITYTTTLRTHYLSVLLYEENFSAFWSHSGADHSFHLLSSLIISCKSDLIHYFTCSDETFKVETCSSKQTLISSTCLFL